MKWITKLLNKSDNKKPSAPPSPPPARPAPPAEDADTLRGALATAGDGGGRTQLADRLGRALAAQARMPQAADPPEIWVAAICHVPDKALALAWMEGLEGDAWLGEVARAARSTEVRLAAARRIGATEVLEQVARANRDKDKRVYRHCADQLRQRRQVEASDRRAGEIAAELDGLLEASPLPLTRVLDLKKELDGLGEGGESVRECTDLMERALARLQQESEARHGLQTLQGEVAALASECGDADWPWIDRLDGWRGRLETLVQARAALPAWLAAEAGAHALGESLAGIQARLSELVADAERIPACERFLDALDADAAPDAAMAETWKALDKPVHPSIRRALESRWQARLGSVPPVPQIEPTPTPPPTPPSRPRIDRDALHGLLDALEQAIEQGHLADADAAAKGVRAMLDGEALRGSLESRWQRLQAQLEGLRGWARWGTGQAREQLISAAEALLNGERDVEALAADIAALRAEWKRLDAHGGAAKAQWESFDALLEKAYAPVAAHRAEIQAQQALAGTAKTSLCTEWEAEVAGIVWEYADFKVVEARRAEMIKQWRAAPRAGFRDERQLKKRFDTLIAGIDQRLDTARAAEAERREQLITTAEALGGEADLGRAMTEAKALQGRWTQEAAPVRLKRGVEQKLWQRFRAACNTVFERRDALRAEQVAEREAQSQARQRLLDAFAATLDGVDANGIRQAITRFRTDWEASRPNGRDSTDGLEARAHELEQQARRRLDELRRDKYVADLDLLARKAALAERVEAAALADGPVEEAISEVTQAWDGMPRLSGKTESLLAGRLQEAGSITSAKLAAGHEARETLLLDLEIALGLPSPEDCAEARRQRQLEQLQHHFGGTLPQGAEPERLLARWYATAALPDPAFEPRIATVVRRLAEQAVSGGRT
jgi:hypothetical protein